MTMPAKGSSIWSRAQFGVSYVQETRDPKDQNVLEGISDPWGSGSLYLTRLGHGGRLKVGRIVYSLPYLNWYRVLVEEEGDFACLHASPDTTLGPMGPRSTAMLAPGSLALLVLHPTDPMGYIIAALPDITENGRLVYPDWISQGSNVGFKREGYYDEVLALTDSGDFVDLSCNRPQDATVFDWGRISDLGGLIHQDLFYHQFRISETCGLFLHYINELSRLTGMNLDVITAGSERQDRDDEGEYTTQYGETPYPWEAMGVFSVGDEALRETDHKEVQYEKPEAALEPKEDDQQAFYRYREFGGYLGQGRIREVQLPPKDVELYRYGQNDEKSPVVFREHIGLDGSYSLASAKSVFIAKRPTLGNIKQTKLPEDHTGDHTENYKSAGVQGDGDEHVVGDVSGEAGSGPNAAALGAAATVQQHAYAFNWKPLVGFHYHAKDWVLGEEEESPFAQGFQKPELNKLASQQWLDVPESKEYKVDDRFGDSKFYQIMSHISLTDEGYIVISTGEGASITLGGGNITLACPGDLLVQTGRSVIQLAGDDFVVKARNSADITATDKDVRIKAQKNLQVASAEGGILLESRAATEAHEYKEKQGEDVVSSGIVMRAPRSRVATMSKDLYLRTGVTTQEDGTQKGDIVIDAAKGDNDIKLIAKNHVRHIGSKASDYFGITQQRSANEYSDGLTKLNGTTEVNGALLAKGSFTCESGISVTNGHISTSQAGSSGRVAQLRNPSSQVRLDQVATNSRQLTSNAADHWKEKVQELFYGTNKIGSDDLQKLIEFSFRNEKQYRTTEYKLIRTRWQELAGQDLDNWTERLLRTQSKDMMPWPGYKRWYEDKAFYSLESKLCDPDTGVAKDRTEEDYENKELGGWKEPTKLDGNYPVISA